LIWSNTFFRISCLVLSVPYQLELAAVPVKAPASQGGGAGRSLSFVAANVKTSLTDREVQGTAPAALALVDGVLFLKVAVPVLRLSTIGQTAVRSMLNPLIPPLGSRLPSLIPGVLAREIKTRAWPGKNVQPRTSKGSRSATSAIASHTQSSPKRPRRAPLCNAEPNERLAGILPFAGDCRRSSSSVVFVGTTCHAEGRGFESRRSRLMRAANLRTPASSESRCAEHYLDSDCLACFVLALSRERTLALGAPRPFGAGPYSRAMANSEDRVYARASPLSKSARAHGERPPGMLGQPG
jgi:hypothetical protein